MASVANIYVDQGSDYSAIITIVGSNGNPLPLTDFQVESELRKFHDSSKSYCFNATIADAARGRVRVRLSADQSQNMPAGRWLFDVRVVSPTGLKKRVIEGVVIIVPQSTKGPCP